MKKAINVVYKNIFFGFTNGAAKTARRARQICKAIVSVRRRDGALHCLRTWFMS